MNSKKRRVKGAGGVRNRKREISKGKKAKNCQTVHHPSLPVAGVSNWCSRYGDQCVEFSKG